MEKVSPTVISIYNRLSNKGKNAVWRCLLGHGNFGGIDEEKGFCANVFNGNILIISLLCVTTKRLFQLKQVGYVTVKNIDEVFRKHGIIIGIDSSTITNATSEDMVIGDSLAIPQYMDLLETEVDDPVNPNHYKQYPVEAIEMMIRIFGAENTYIFCILNAFKYRMRLGHKDSVEQELKKEKWLLDKAKEIKEQYNLKDELR